MGRYGHFLEYGAGGSWSGNWAVVLGVGLAALVLLLIVASLVGRRGHGNGQVGVDPEIYDNMDGQIRSMLVQWGGALSQDSIANNLAVPVADLARTLREMEARGEILRVWMPGDYTYGVQIVEKEREPACRVRGCSTQPNA